MLCLIFQTKRKYKQKNKEDLDGKDIQNDEMSEDTQEEDSTNGNMTKTAVSHSRMIQRTHQAKKMNWKIGLS